MTGILAAILIVVLVGSLVVGVIVGWFEGPYRYGEHQATTYLGAGVVWLILAVVLALILAGQL